MGSNKLAGTVEGRYLTSLNTGRRAARIVVATNDVVLGKGLCARLRHWRRGQIVGEAHTVAEIVKLVRAQNPDVLIVDGAMPGVTCSTIKEVHAMYPCLKVVGICGTFSPATVSEAYKGGVCGFMTPAHAIRDVRDAIEKVVAGERYYSPEISESLLALVSLAKTGKDGALLTMTCRQREILRLMGQRVGVKSISGLWIVDQGGNRCPRQSDHQLLHLVPWRPRGTDALTLRKTLGPAALFSWLNRRNASDSVYPSQGWGGRLWGW